MSEYQGQDSVRYPSCVFNYGNGKLLSIGYEGELYTRKTEKDARAEKMGRRIAELESLARDMGEYIDGILNRRYTINVSHGHELLGTAESLGIEAPDA